MALHQGDEVEGESIWSASLKATIHLSSTTVLTSCHFHQVVPGCYAYRFLVDGEWKNAVEAELAKDYDGELVSLIIVEEEEEEVDHEEKVKQKGDGGEDVVVKEVEKFDFEQKDEGDKLVERDQRRGVGAC